MAKNDGVSISVIKRLPRYYRFLGELKEQGIVRISSKDLSAKMGFTASQIRQDLNCFGDLVSKAMVTTQKVFTVKQAIFLV